ncbi:hypothetical protein [Fictibacillus barbaricus]|uniref:Uncharacterized protein n=1 Tax=Fictibacillus barbaricus TaxID=182136 RepID=A0ABU1U3V8_9BACL|nr:hypothetical protein [Fictibacillus barbaricus]MDR7074167.1 hypothetical protein [Fictibacillus barbaricus]
MKRYITLITMVIMLSGCGVEDSQINKMLNIMAEDTELTEHLSSLKFSLFEENGYEDDIKGKLSSSFDSLSPKEQNKFFNRINEIAAKNNGDPDDGSFFCGKNYECTINNIVLKTKKHTYSQRYSEGNDMVAALYKDDQLIYDPNEEDKQPVTETAPIEEVDETADEDVIEEPIEETQEVTTIDLHSADGNDWITLTSAEKINLINEALTNIKSHGTVVTAEPQWFVEALDAFYGDEMTNSTHVTEAIAMSGVAGGVIE